MHSISSYASLVLGLVSFTSFLLPVFAQDPAVVGREVLYDLVINTTDRSPFQRTVGTAGATFMTVHFAEFSLADGDKVTVSSTDGLTSYSYSGLGRGNLGISGGFFSSLIPGDEALITYEPASSTFEGNYGFTIDKVTRSTSSASISTICGTDDSEPVKCLINSTDLPDAYEKSQAVARLFINGTEMCSGWLIGSEGHLLTNFHCIGSASDAATTDFEFGAESASCEEQCQTKNGCPGTVLATASSLIASDEDLDYALVKLDATSQALSGYGYLTLRVAGATEGERIYLPQHPKGWAKRVSTVLDDGNATIISAVDHSSPCGSHRLSYGADTQPGSSGSPVIAASDNTVVGLHNCGVLDDDACENAAIDIRAVIWDLRQKNVVPADALDDPTAELADGPWIPGATSAPTPAPTPAPTVSICTIFRQQSTCTTVVPGNKCVWQNGVCIPNPALST